MIALEPREQPSRLLSLLSPVIAIALTLLAGGLMLWAMGKEPLNALHVFFVSPFMDGYLRSELAVKAVPLAIIGAGLALCFRANVWNIGAAGQYTMGAVFAGWVALNWPDLPGWVALPAFLLAGVIGGGLFAAIPAMLRTRFNANEILVSLMLTYVAALFLDWLVRGPWKDPRAFGFPQTPDFAQAYIMPLLDSGSRLHLGLVIAVVLCIALGVMLLFTLRGFQIQVMGAAPRAGSFAGFSQVGTIWFVLVLSGGLAGLAGAIEVSATVQKLQPEISAQYGFIAIIVAFLGRLNPFGALLAAFVLAVSFIGGENAQMFLKLPKNVTGIFQGMLLFFLLACDTLIRYRLRLGRARPEVA